MTVGLDDQGIVRVDCDELGVLAFAAMSLLKKLGNAKPGPRDLDKRAGLKK